MCEELKYSKLKQEIWMARNNYIRDNAGNKPSVIIVHISDWFKLGNELDPYELIDFEGKLTPFFGMNMIRTEDIEKGTFIIK